MSRPLAGKVVLVTGAGGGIGGATALELARRGAKPVLADLDAEALEAVAARFDEPPLTVEVDVTDRASAEAAVEAAVERHGGLDAVWANAGISAFGPLELVDPDVWTRVVQVNLLGAYTTVRAALPHVIERRGYVAVTCSLASFAHQPGMSAYAASKAGLEAMANALRIEVAHQGVDVGTIHPGWIATGMVTEKEDHQPAFRRFREALRPPFDASVPVERIVPDVAGAFERRASRVVTPRSGWAAHAARPLLATKALTRDVRAAAPDIRRLFAEQAAAEGADAAAMSARYRSRA